MALDSLWHLQAFRASLLCALGAAGCASQGTAAHGANARASRLDSIVMHDVFPPPVVEGASVKQPQALRAGTWDSPKQMYQATCQQCHAESLLGRVSAGAVVRTARNGRGAMPAFLPSEYSDADLEALGAWIAQQPKAEKAAS